MDSLAGNVPNLMLSLVSAMAVPMDTPTSPSSDSGHSVETAIVGNVPVPENALNEEVLSTPTVSPIATPLHHDLATQLAFEDVIRYSLLLHRYTENQKKKFRKLQIDDGASDHVVFIIGPVTKRLDYLDIHVWAQLLADRKILGIPPPFLCDKEPGGDTALLIFKPMAPEEQADLVAKMGRLPLNSGCYFTRMNIFTHAFDESVNVTPQISLRVGQGWLAKSGFGFHNAYRMGRLQGIIAAPPARFVDMYTKPVLKKRGNSGDINPRPRVIFKLVIHPNDAAADTDFELDVRRSPLPADRALEAPNPDGMIY